MDRKQFGLLRSVKALAGEVVFGWPTLWGLLLGIGGGWGLLTVTHAAERHGIAGDFLVVLAPLLGVVLAAFALVIGMFSDRYLLLLHKGPNGVIGFLRPFFVAIGVLVATIVVTIAYRACGTLVYSKIEVGLWLVNCFLFVYAMTDIVEVARTVIAHGVTRAEDLATDESGNNVVPHARTR